MPGSQAVDPPPWARRPTLAGRGPAVLPDDVPAVVPELEVVVNPVAATLAEWHRALAASHLPNTLLDSRPAAGSWIDLTSAHPSGLAQLLAGRPTRLSSLVRAPGGQARASRRARGLRASAAELAAERGVRSCFLVAGLASWPAGPIAVATPGGAGAPIRAPVLLRACALQPIGGGQEDYEIDLASTAMVNPELLRALAAEHALRPDAELLAGLSFGQHGFDPSPVLDRLADLCADVPGFSLERSLVIGTFTAGADALQADLTDAVPALVAHPVLGPVLAGRPAEAAEPDGAPRATAQPPRPDPAQPLDLDPAQPLDLDPAQQRAVTLARAGGHLLIEGPGGSGLTHTLAAIALQAAIAGKTVLAVADRREIAASLLDRLAASGLGEVVLDLHDGAGDPDRIRADLAAALAQLPAPGSHQPGHQTGPTSVSGPAQSPDPDDPGSDAATGLTGRWRRLHDQLQESAAALHAVRPPWGVSAYQAMARIADLLAGEHPPRGSTRLPGHTLVRLTPQARAEVAQTLREAAAEGVFARGPASPWQDAEVPDEPAADAALAAAVAALRELPAAEAAMARLNHEAGLRGCEAVRDWRPRLELLIGVRDTLDKLLPAVFEQPIDDLIGALDESTHLGWRARRSLRRRAHELVRPGVQIDDLHGALLAAREQRAAWSQVGEAGGWPRVPGGLPAAVAAVDDVLAALGPLDRALPAAGLLARPLPELADRLQALTGDKPGLLAQPTRRRVLGALRERGLGPLIDELLVSGAPSDEAGAAQMTAELELSWWASALELIVRADPMLSRHDGAAMRQAAADFRLVDAAVLRQAAGTARRVLTARAAAAARANPGQAKWLGAAVHHQQRAQWPHDLFRHAGALVAALRPVWVMSPEAVARLLPLAGGQPVADLVLLDDAGQVRLADAAAALTRGRQLVVAGDRLRIGPADGSTSVLAALAGRVPLVRLDRNHRVRDARVLVPIRSRYPGWSADPSPDPQPALRVVTAADGTAADGAPLVDQAVSLVTAQLAAGGHRPGAPGVAPVLVVAADDRLADQLTERLEPLAGGAVDVRPIRRLAGIWAERLVAVCSRELDEAELATVLTRASDSITLLSTAPGATIAPSPAPDPAAPPADPLAADLAHRLRRAGVPVRLGHGAADWPIDLALMDPADPGRGLIAVELDGSRRAGVPLRERERQRRERLERAGWVCCPVAAMDLFLDPHAEVARLSRLWQQLRDGPQVADRPTMSSPMPPPDPEEPGEADDSNDERLIADRPPHW